MTKSKKGRNLSQEELENFILKKFIRNPKKRYSAHLLKNKYRLSNSMDSIEESLKSLQSKGSAFLAKPGKYRLDKTYKSNSDEKTLKTYIGQVDMTQSGSAYILVQELEDDIYVSNNDINGAFHGDRVRVVLLNKRRRRAEGRILEVVERANKKFVGTYRIFGNEALVLIHHPKMNIEVIVSIQAAEDGDQVVVRIDQYGKTQNRKFRGTVLSVFPKEDANEVAMQSILINNGFDLNFEDSLINEADALKMNVENEINKRLDLRDINTFTIDPDDAKDFDDALSIEFLEDEKVRIGIHIADVTHFVKEGSALDKEAYNRSTSVYLVDRVCPMLPEKISNDLCSLRPNEDKFTFSVLATFDKDRKIVSQWFGKTIIHSKRRFTYDQAQEVIDDKSGDLSKELLYLNTLAKEMRQERFKKGSINFDSAEVRFILDDNKKPIKVYTKDRKDTHLLVEEYMLLANQLVAMFIHKKGKGKEIPFVYRSHDLPNPDKVRDLAAFAAEFGIKLNVDTPENIAKSFNLLTAKADENEVLKLLAPMAIRSMAKAEYTTTNIGHYGLGFDYYSHFTSPIRRYSDVLSHRILEANLESIKRVDKGKLEEKCTHISAQERKAMTAERESLKYKQVEFMSDKVGQEFEGIISGIIDKGVFVELIESHAEGLIRFDTFDEAYDIPDSRLKAVGKKTGKTIKMGDRVKVVITGTDMDRVTIDMAFVD